MNGVKRDSIVCVALILAIILGALVPYLTDGTASAAQSGACRGGWVAQVDPAAAGYVLGVEFGDEPILQAMARRYGVSEQVLAYDWRAWELNWGERFKAHNGSYPDAETFVFPSVWADLVNGFAGCKGFELPLREDGGWIESYHAWRLW